VSALDSLIRVNRYKLDERRRQLAELERLAERLRGETARLEAELTQEQRVASSSFEAGQAYPAYAGDVAERRAKLAASITEVDGQILAAREALAESFREVKRYEITAASRSRRDRLAVDRRQRIAQDEVAMQIHRRRGDASS
jgi:chromosome segregation ATPase